MVGRRADGYHELRTVFQTVDLADTLELTATAGGVELIVASGSAPGGADNLAAAAAAAFLERWAPDRGLRIVLHKRIPLGGGLGGGSSNAATVLAAMPHLLGVVAAAGEVWEVARNLGADVPYFLVGGTALGVGRGDEVVPLPDLPEQEVWLATPPQQVSTAEVFGRLATVGASAWSPHLLDLVHGEGSGEIAGIGGRNDLEAGVLDAYPGVAAVYNALLEAGASCVRLSGSGATVFACFRSEEAGERAVALLPSETSVVRTRTLSRATLRRRRPYAAAGEGS